MLIMTKKTHIIAVNDKGCINKTGNDKGDRHKSCQ